MTLSDELSRLAELRDRGALTEQEFMRAKERLLSSERTAQETPFVPAVNALRRSRDDRWIGGVCGGIARATGLDAWAWRLIFTALLLFGGVGLVVYVLLWIFVPSE